MDGSRIRPEKIEKMREQVFKGPFSKAAEKKSSSLEGILKPEQKLL
jgi:hypothetical protein